MPKISKDKSEFLDTLIIKLIVKMPYTIFLKIFY